MKYLCFLLPIFILSCQSGEFDMKSYHGQLDYLREKCMPYDLNAPEFYLFGMGNRDKFIYKNFQLVNIENDSVVYSFGDAVSDSIIPDEYMVRVKTNTGYIVVYEDENGIWLQEGDRLDSLHSHYCHVILPDFAMKKFSKVLKVLHHEILFNIKDSQIYPNILVYRKPFLRDAFMGALCLEQTGNTNLLKSWIESINDIYDMQNGEEEPDNLGELLYLLTLISPDSNLKVRHKLYEEIERKTVIDGNLKYISGHTDGNDNAEYQTQILKYALEKAGMKDSYTNARVPGFYYNLCWFTKGDNNKQTLRQLLDFWRYGDRDLPWPYLMWARAHYYGNFQAPFNAQNYPLSWEQNGESAFYDSMKKISSKAVDDKMCYPHVWSAAEMFLKLIQYEE